MKIEVSNGEILDKLSILNIKVSKIQDPDKLKNTIEEQQYLSSVSQTLLESANISLLFHNLQCVNLELWNIEDNIRKKEKLQEFDDIFIHLARQVYFKNDYRAKIKKEINLVSKSSFVEEKSYEQY